MTKKSDEGKLRKRHSVKYYTRVKTEFKRFLANPEDTRKQKEFAKERGIAPQTLSNWKREEGFWDEIWDLFANHYLQGQLPEINRVLIRKARRGDTRAMDKVYKLAGRLEEKVKHEVEVDEKLQEVIDRFAETLPK